MANTIDNFDDMIDSRDVIARIEELEGEREALFILANEAHEALVHDVAEYDGDDPQGFAQDLEEKHDNAHAAIEAWDDSDAGKELAILKALADEASGCAADWQHGETLIRDSYFKDYAQELAEDCGDVKWSELCWPLTCIDWDQAARELQMDYSAVDFDGVTYWVR